MLETGPAVIDPGVPDGTAVPDINVNLTVNEERF